MRKGDAFSLAREKMTNPEVFKNYFELLKETLLEYNLMDRPSQIYNCDESGMPLEHKLPRIISAKGAKKIRQITSGNKTQITILGCCNATGQTIPPMVVFTGKHFNFSNHFLSHAVSCRPLILMLDGHSSHYTLELIKLAAENDVIIFCLPPHTTADSQPLDIGCFGPLKVYWSEVCRQFMFNNPGRVVSKLYFSKLFAQA